MRFHYPVSCVGLFSDHVVFEVERIGRIGHVRVRHDAVYNEHSLLAL